MKKVLFLVPLILVTGLYFLGKTVQSSGTYTPSVTISLADLPKTPEDISKNIKVWFENSFEPILTFPGVEKAWRHRIFSKIILSYVDIEKVRPIGLKDLKPKTYVKGLGVARDLIHRLAGIKNWTLSGAKFDRKKQKKLARFRLKGTYLNSKGEKILFHENHVFQGRHFYQWQLNLPENLKDEMDDKVVASLLKYLESRK